MNELVILCEKEKQRDKEESELYCSVSSHCCDNATCF